MDKRIVIGYGVASLFMLGVILLAVLPFPQAATPTPAVRQLAAPTSQYATNFTAINAEEVDATTLNATTGNITTLNATTGTITTLGVTTLISQAVTFSGENATLTGTVNIANGTNSLPSVAFTSDPNTGLYRVGADDIGLTAGGVKVFDCIATGCTNTGTLAATGAAALNAGITVDTSAFTVADVTGNVATTGTLNVTGASTLTGAVAANGNIAVTVPTAVASATPAARINNIGAANDSLVIEKNATPVFKIGNGGVVTGFVLSNGTSGQKIVCGSQNITGTATIAHGLATPSYVQVSIAGDLTGDAAIASFTNASAVVTGKVWGSALTPAPNTTPVAVQWCVIGTP